MKEPRRITFACRCGEWLTVDAALRGRQALCPQCRTRLEIPAFSDPSAPQEDEPPETDAEAPATPPEAAPAPESPAEEAEILEPASTELVHAADGAAQWKLVCLCGKHILTPGTNVAPTGRCPKCGRRLRLPSQRGAQTAKGEAARAPAREPASERPAASPIPAPRPASAPSGPPDEDDDLGLLIAEQPAPARVAAIQTADRLRAHMTASAREAGPGLVSAWPLAGRLPRALAGFIDLTFATVVTGVVVVLASLNVLPEACRHIAAVPVVFIVTSLFNDGLLQLLGGGLGKRLVVLTLRGHDGQEVSGGLVVLRALVKWILFPGWAWVLIDPAERALHDRICGTLVLKGRSGT